MIREKLFERLKDMDKAAGFFGITDFEIYFLGGAACVLANYTERATRDFDFIENKYSSQMGRIFAMLRDFDMLEYAATILASDYKNRAIKIDGIENFKAYTLSPEDIVLSKIIRLEEKDIEDIDILIKLCDKDLILKLAENIMQRTDLYEKKKEIFKKNFQLFMVKYYV